MSTCILLTPCIVLLDMDSTLSDPSHRINFIEKKDYDNWYKESINDLPNADVVFLVQSLFIAYPESIQFVIFTGRPEAYRRHTIRWLEEYLGSSFAKKVILYMRPNGDYTKDSILKKRMLQKLRKELPLPIRFAIDDRSSVVEMYRSNGITTFQCNDGQY